MRVVVLTQWFPPEQAAMPADIAEGLAAVGHEVTVVTGFPNYPSGKIYDGWRQQPWLDQVTDSYAVRRVWLYPSHDRSPIRRAANYASFALSSAAFGWSHLRGADVVYVYHPPLTAAMGPWLSRALGGAPYVLHVQDLWPESVTEAGLLSDGATRTAARLLSVACDAVYRRASGVISIAPTMATLLRDRGVSANRLHVVPNWADEAIFRPAPRDESLSREMGFAGRFTVMFAGNLGDLQGLNIAVRAAAEVRDLADFRLVLVGDGLARQSLERFAEELGADNVVFIPPQPLSAMNALTHAADVQLVCLRDLPFLRGTIPSKLGSVMASGLPVICAVGGDSAQLVQSAGAGWAVEPENVSALSTAFREAHETTKRQRTDHGKAARRFYESNLSREFGVRTIVNVLSEAANE